jgi:hypothetical protein
MSIIHRYDAAHRTLKALTKRGTFQLYQMHQQLEAYCARWSDFRPSYKYQRADALAGFIFWELERRNHAKHFGHFEHKKLDEARRVFVKLSLMDAQQRAAH